MTLPLLKPGPMYYKGIYHLFYQYNPNGSLWGNIIWGHSVSTDLINWIRLEPALDRTTPSDNNGCWSGSATILAPDSPVILYTGSDSSNRQVQNIAFPVNLTDPYLTKWTKPAYNPLIEPVGDLNSSEFRDPTTGWVGKDNLWRIAIGAELQGKGAAILYKSKDFVNWVRAKDPLHSSSASGMWECPDFYPAVAEGDGSETKYVLKMSLTETGMDYYMLGKYEEERDAFVPDNVVDDYRLWARIDFGKFYASKSFFDPQKHRRVLYGWSSESDSASDDVAKGWAGIHTIPRTIWLDNSGKQLLQWPIEEVESLRKDEVHLQDIELNTGAVFEVKELKEASQADVEAEFELYNLERAEPLDPNWLLDPQKLCEEQSASAPGGVGPFGLLLLASDDLVEHTAVYFKVYRSSSRPGLYKPAYGGFLDVHLQKERKISLRTLRCCPVVLERATLTEAVLPNRAREPRSNVRGFGRDRSLERYGSERCGGRGDRKGEEFREAVAREVQDNDGYGARVHRRGVPEAEVALLEVVPRGDGFGGPITKKCLPAVMQLPCLEDLALAGCLGINDQALLSLKQGCMSLGVLDVSNCQHVTHLGLSSILSRAPGLCQLNLVYFCPLLLCSLLNLWPAAYRNSRNCSQSD
uniref:Beta-fructofuranosidase, insoluble isoenzyme 4 n=1 Tax=Ananas comosus var. bracteatus TaxID=296719 RepID=A0A6V7P1J7_ANACO|nr:unnamed protein product [Ananas comosus var. bracteatus]